LLGVHVILFLLELVAEVAPVPEVDARVGVAGFLDLEAAELRQLRVELGLQTGLEFLQKVHGRGRVGGHFDFNPVIRPGRVAELAGDVIPQRQDLFQQRQVALAGEIIALELEPFAGFLTAGVVHHAQEVPGDVGLDGVFIRAGFGLRQKAFRNALQLGPGELHVLLRPGDVGLVVGHQARQLFAQPFHLVALGLGQVQAGAAVIAHRLEQQLGRLALQLRLAMGVSLDRLIDILAIIQPDGPLLQFLERVGGGFAQGGVGAGFLDQSKPVAGEVDLVADIVQGAHGVFKGDLAGLQAAKLVQGGVAAGDGFPQVQADLIGRRLELRQGDDRVKGRGALAKLLQPIRRGGRLGHANAYNQQAGQQQQRKHLIRHTARNLMPERADARGNRRRPNPNLGPIGISA